MKITNQMIADLDLKHSPKNEFETDNAFFAFCRELIAMAQEAAPEVKPDGWIRAIDEALVCHHLDVANADDSYAIAKDKLNKLLCINQDIHDYFKKSDVVERIRALPVGFAGSGTYVRLEDVLEIIEGAKLKAPKLPERLG